MHVFKLKHMFAGAAVMLMAGTAAAAPAEPESEPRPPMREVRGDTKEARLDSFREEAAKLTPSPVSRQTIQHYRAVKTPKLELSNRASEFEVKIVGFSDLGLIYEIEAPPPEVLRMPQAQRDIVLRSRYYRTARMTGDTHALLRNHVGDTMVLDIRTDRKGFGYVVGVKTTRGTK